jgi:hypothetical protein
MGFDPVRPAIAGGSPGALLRRLSASGSTRECLPLFGLEPFQLLVAAAFLHRGGHAGQQVLRLRQEVAVEDLGDFMSFISSLLLILAMDRTGVLFPPCQSIS